MGCAHFAAGRYDRAVRWVESGVRMSTGSFWAQRVAVAAAAMTGARSEACRMGRQLMRRTPTLRSPKRGKPGHSGRSLCPASAMVSTSQSCRRPESLFHCRQPDDQPNARTVVERHGGGEERNRRCHFSNANRMAVIGPEGTPKMG